MRAVRSTLCALQGVERRVQSMRLLPLRSAFLLPPLLVVVVACGAHAPVATPTPTLALTPTPAPALTATPTLTPGPTVEPSQDGQTAMLLQRAEQVRMEIVDATQEGCAFVYEEGEWRRSGSGAAGGGAGPDVPYGRVARTRVEFGPGGQFRGEGQSVTGLQNTLSGGGTVGADIPAWLDEQVAELADMLARGWYVGESSLIGQPSLRYEMRMEGGASGAAESLFVFDYVIDNPFIRLEQQYAVAVDGQLHLERQWATSEFGVEGCASDGEAVGSAGEAVAVEIERNALDVHDGLLASIDAGCALAFSVEYDSAPRTDRVEGGDARDVLAWFVAIAGIGNPENASGDDSAMGAPSIEYAYAYAGETELFGRPAVRFEHSEVRAGESGLTNYLNVWEFVRENPLLSRATVYGAVLPDGAPAMVHRQTVSGLAADCG